jgi:hypothetical protein
MDSHAREIGAKYLKKRGESMLACLMQCFRLAEVKEGRYAGVQVAGPMRQESIMPWRKMRYR